MSRLATMKRMDPWNVGIRRSDAMGSLLSASPQERRCRPISMRVATPSDKKTAAKKGEERKTEQAGAKGEAGDGSKGPSEQLEGTRRSNTDQSKRRKKHQRPASRRNLQRGTRHDLLPAFELSEHSLRRMRDPLLVPDLRSHSQPASQSVTGRYTSQSCRESTLAHLTEVKRLLVASDRAGLGTHTFES